MRNGKNIILNQSKDTLSMVDYLDCDVVFLSVFQTDTDILVQYEVIRRCPPRTCAERFKQPSY